MERNDGKSMKTVVPENDFPSILVGLNCEFRVIRKLVDLANAFGRSSVRISEAFLPDVRLRSCLVL